VISNKEIVLLSDGKATRTFCYIADAICGYIKALVNGRSGEPYNIGTQSPEISMRQLAEHVSRIGNELCGYKGKIIYKTSGDTNYLVDSPNRRCPDITKAINELGYNPRIGIEEGIRNSFIWYKGNNK
jgi:nucleoside-diphosphate-sugar epimerase